MTALIPVLWPEAGSRRPVAGCWLRAAGCPVKDENRDIGRDEDNVVQPSGAVERGCVVSADAEIYTKHCDDLVRYATTLVGPDEAADVVSTVILKVLSKRSLADLQEPRPYLFRAVLNEARSTLRRRRPQWTSTESDAVEVSEPHSEVLQAVLDLPARQRAATYLVYWEGLTMAETADLMGTRPGTVKRYLHLARNRMRGVFDEHAG